jgi:hypothetical protein
MNYKFPSSFELTMHSEVKSVKFYTYVKAASVI